MKKVIAIICTILTCFFLLFAPILIIGTLVSVPFEFINSLLNDDQVETDDLCVLIGLHYETEDALNDYQTYYKPAIDENKHTRDMEISLPWLSIINLAAQVEPTGTIVRSQIDAMTNVEYIYDEKGNVIDVLYSLSDLDTYITRIRQQLPWSSSWDNVTQEKIKKLMDCNESASIEQVGQSGVPDNLEEMLETYDFAYPFHRRANINAPFGFSAIYGSIFHNGIDLGFDGVYGEPIYSSTKGIVTFSGIDPDGANVVLIRYGELSILYGHMENRSPLSVGDAVEQGDFIGTVGSTGNSTGPHLHFEIQQGNKRYDPALFIEF